MDIEDSIKDPISQNAIKQMDKHSKLENMVKDISLYSISSQSAFNKFKKLMMKKYHIGFKNSDLREVYVSMLARGALYRNTDFEYYSKTSKVRENSGVIVFTVLMSPYPETGEVSMIFWLWKLISILFIIGKIIIYIPLQIFPSINDLYVNYYASIREYFSQRINIDTSEKRQNFTCKYNCHYCPKFPKMPRSYIPNEPAVARGIQNNWDPVAQIRARAKTYRANGIEIDKMEVIIEGGTYTNYPEYYRIRFIRDLYYAANTLNTSTLREKLTLVEEMKINENAECKIIGMSIETRPDCVTGNDIREFRKCGITRVQLGIQHTDDEILRLINRQCSSARAQRGIKMLKDTGFKVALHLMPDLPGSNPKKDEKMFNEILTSDGFAPDFLKIYPTMVTPHTEIKKWYDEGTYKPYVEESAPHDKNIINPLVKVVAEFKAKIHPWIRIERVIRDIPAQDIDGGTKTSDMRNVIQDYMKAHQMICKCIRCREVKNKVIDSNNMKLIIRTYNAHKGIEYFISYEDNEETTIYGFCRMRLSPDSGANIIKELKNTAMIRELHVYGKMQPVGSTKGKDSAQHLGLGKKLMAKAEEIAKDNGYVRISVIAGEGVKNYYRKLGYTDGKYYLLKKF